MSRRSATLFRAIAQKELQGVRVPPAKNGVKIVDAKLVEEAAEAKRQVAATSK